MKCPKRVLIGPWTARSIAMDLCTRIGLTCVWGARNYNMRVDTVVNGPILSTLQSLVEPFNHFERSKSDIWVEGTTVFIRPRGESGSGITMDAHDSRILDMTIQAKPAGLIRVLRLLGSRTGNQNNFLAVDPGVEETETTNETLHPITEAVTLRTVTKRRTRKLDNACLSETIDTFRDAMLKVGSAGQVELVPMHLVGRAETISDWDELTLVYPNKIVNQPKEHSRVTTDYVYDPETTFGTLKQQKRTMIMNDYDLEGFCRCQDTRKEIFEDLSSQVTGGGALGSWTFVKAESKKYDRNGAGMYQITTTQYGADGVAGDCHRTIANGEPPGGPGHTVAGNTNSNAQGTPITYGILISSELGAKDITIDNPNLLLEDLLYIKAQALASSGSTEVEISFSAAGMPWIRRGQFITLTGLFAEDGTTPIPLAAALVTEARVEYRETSKTPTYLTYVKALFWEGP